MIIKTVQNPTQGSEIAKTLLYKYADEKTVLFLSGGSTPRRLYEAMAKEKKLNSGAVALVDERYGLPFHLNSNEKMIRDTGFLSFLEEKKIPFYSVLRALPSHPEFISGSHFAKSDLVLLEMLKLVQHDKKKVRRQTEGVDLTAREYAKIVKTLFSRFKKRIAIMGIGEDGHTAGLPPGSQNSKVKSQKYVVRIKDFPGEFKERITLTFNALSKMDLLIILAFGSAKKNALNLMFSNGSEEEIPARFYAKPEITGKTILITDQKV